MTARSPLASPNLPRRGSPREVRNRADGSKVAPGNSEPTVGRRRATEGLSGPAGLERRKGRPACGLCKICCRKSKARPEKARSRANQGDPSRGQGLLSDPAERYLNMENNSTSSNDLLDPGPMHPAVLLWETGRASGVLAIEYDLPGQIHRALTPDHVVHTAGGSVGHRYFAYPQDGLSYPSTVLQFPFRTWPQESGGVLPEGGLRICADRGYVVAPRAPRGTPGGGMFARLCVCDLSPVPTWLSEQLQPIAQRVTFANARFITHPGSA